MPTLIDLSIPVRHGDGRMGLEVAFSTPYSFETCGWQGSSFSMFAHYATHVDAPNHFIEGAHGIDEAPISRLMGAAALIPLDDHGAEKAIAADTLEDRGRHVRRGDIVILRTGWSDRHWGQPAFWTSGPYLDHRICPPAREDQRTALRHLRLAAEARRPRRRARARGGDRGHGLSGGVHRHRLIGVAKNFARKRTLRDRSVHFQQACFPNH
jgi:hypothetical protein